MNIIKVRNKFEISEFHQITYTLYKDIKNWIPHIRQDLESVFDPKKNSYHKDGEIKEVEDGITYNIIESEDYYKFYIHFHLTIF